MNPAQNPSPDLSAHVIEAVADAVIYADREGTIRVWNQGATAVFGFSAEEALGAHLDLIIPERLREAHWKGFAAAMDRGATTGGRRARLTRGRHKDPDRKLYVEMTFAVVVSETGTTTGSVAIARDVTEKRLKEAEGGGLPPGGRGARDGRADSR